MGLVRVLPWHFVGLFRTAAEAHAAREEFGSEYIVRHGVPLMFAAARSKKLSTTGGMMKKEMLPQLPNDPVNDGWVKGWGLVRNTPWHLAGVFATQAEAEVEAKRLGLDDGYSVGYGSHRLGSDDFVYADS